MSSAHMLLAVLALLGLLFGCSTCPTASSQGLYPKPPASLYQEMPALPLYYPVYSYAVDQQVQGVSMGPLFDLSDRLNTIRSWFLVARRPASTSPPVTLTP